MKVPVVTKLDMRQTRREQGKTALVNVCTLALAAEYYQKVEKDEAAAALCKEGLRVIESNNTVYVTLEVFALIHTRMNAKAAVKALLLPGL